MYERKRQEETDIEREEYKLSDKSIFAIHLCHTI